jgi:lipid-A-disaccharide synthase-like uncharacterized protein
MIGFIAQFMFSMRFVVQWLATEKARASITPETFWYFSLAGGAMLPAYAIDRKQPVFILGQAAGFVIYVATSISSVSANERRTQPKSRGRLNGSGTGVQVQWAVRER